MFEILFRITDKTEYLKALNEKSFDNGGDIEGFFAINANGNYYGHYHNNLLGEDESGWYLISEWLIDLAVAYQELCKSGYVAINDIESFNTWIEFKKEEENLILVSIIKANKEVGTTEIRLCPFPDFDYGEWKLIPIKKSEYYDELVNKISVYINEISEINSNLLGNKNIIKLITLLSKIKK